MEGLRNVMLCFFVGAPFMMAAYYMHIRNGGSWKDPTWEYEPKLKYLYLTGWAMSFGTLAVYFYMTAK